MKYTITVSEEQLKLIMRGLEAISRAGTKQYDYALEQLDTGLFERVGGLDAMWDIREFIRGTEKAGLMKHESLGISNASNDARVSYDMYQVIQKTINHDRYRGFLKTSSADKIKIEETK